MVEEYLEELKNGNDLNDCVLDYDMVVDQE